MKNFSILLATLILCAACSDYTSEPSPPEGLTSGVAIRTPEEAAAIAQSLINAKFASRASDIGIANIVPIGNQGSRSTSDTLIYAVNLTNNQGCVLISAALSGVDIIGHTDEGSFDENSINPNSGFSYYLDAAKDYVATQRASSLIPVPTPDPGNWVELINIEAGPHLKVQWGQNVPEGMFCPNKIAGCTQTAMAQMLTFIGTPTSITLTYPRHDIQSQTLNWSEIIKHNKSTYYYCYCGVPDDTHKAIGRLCRELGYRNGAIYTTSPDATSSNINSARATFSNLCPEKFVSSVKRFYPNDVLVDKLKDNKTIAYVRGDNASSSENASGHAWVCDGVEKMGKAYYETGIGGELIRIENAPIYYHFNWGWCGEHNGWFTAGVFNAESPARSRGGKDFSYNTYFFTVTK